MEDFDKAINNITRKRVESITSQVIDMGNDLTKGKVATEGEVREFSGKKFKKTAGKWIPVTGDKKSKEEDPSKSKGSKEEPSSGGGDKHEVAHLTHMKSIMESDPAKAYEIFQSLSPETQSAVPQEVVNKMVKESHSKPEEGKVDYDKLGEAEKKKEKEEAKPKSNKEDKENAQLIEKIQDGEYEGRIGEDWDEDKWDEIEERLGSQENWDGVDVLAALKNISRKEAHDIWSKQEQNEKDAEKEAKEKEEVKPKSNKDNIDSEAAKKYLGEPEVYEIEDGKMYSFKTADGLIAGVLMKNNTFRIDGISASEVGGGKGSLMFENLISYLSAQGVDKITTSSAGEGAVKMHNKAVDKGLLTKISEKGREGEFKINKKEESQTKPDTLKKALDTINLSQTQISDYLEKGGKRAVIGEIRSFAGRDHIKTVDGWKFHGKGTGKKAQGHKEATSSHQAKPVAKKAGISEKTQVKEKESVQQELNKQRDILTSMNRGKPKQTKAHKDANSRVLNNISILEERLLSANSNNSKEVKKQDSLQSIAESGKKADLYSAVNKKYGTNFKAGSIEEFEDDEMRGQLDESDIKEIVDAEKVSEPKTPTAKQIKEKADQAHLDDLPKEHHDLLDKIYGHKDGVSNRTLPSQEEVNDETLNKLYQSGHLNHKYYRGHGGNWTGTNKGKAAYRALKRNQTKPDTLKKALDTINLSQTQISDYLEKGGKRAVIGEIRSFAGRDHIKTVDGWKFHGKGTGKKAQGHKEATSSHQAKPTEKKEIVNKVDLGVKKWETMEDMTSIYANARQGYSDSYRKTKWFIEDELSLKDITQASLLEVPSKQITLIKEISKKINAKENSDMISCSYKGITFIANGIEERGLTQIIAKTTDIASLEKAFKK